MAASVRTCVGCRRAAPAAELVRLVVDGGRLLCGPRGRHAGRGASIHPRETCVAAAIKTHAFARAFRGALSEVPGPAAVAALAREIEGAHRSQHKREMGKTS